MKVNKGWLITFIAWIVCSSIIVVLPELVQGEGINIPTYMVVEFILTVGLFAAITSVVWIPVGIYASRVYKEKGVKKALTVVGITLICLNLFWLVIYLTLWNG